MSEKQADLAVESMWVQGLAQSRAEEVTEASRASVSLAIKWV